MTSTSNVKALEAWINFLKRQLKVTCDEIWDCVTQRMQDEGTVNKQYDSDLDGVIDFGALPQTDIWNFIKNKLSSEGAHNVIYDSNLDGIVDFSALPQSDIWSFIKNKMQTEGTYNVVYDANLDGIIDFSALPEDDIWTMVGKRLASEGAYNYMYDKDNDGVIDLASIPTIPRSKLEYPTVDVTIAYLAAINKMYHPGGGGSRGAAYKIVTIDSFTDKTIEGMLRDRMLFTARYKDVNNWYEQIFTTGASSSDHQIAKYVDGTRTILGYEAVDLGANSVYYFAFSLSGSTLKGFREDLTTPKISVTDTTFPSGQFGVMSTSGTNDTYPIACKLNPPMTRLPRPVVILEYYVDGTGREEDPIRPAMPTNLVDILKLDNAPDYLRAEARVYSKLKEQGYSDEEIEFIIGSKPNPYVDVLAVSWGAIDYRDTATMIVTVYDIGAEFLDPKRIDRHVEYVKGKNLLCRFIKDSVIDEIYKEIYKAYGELVISLNEFKYHVIGDPKYEILGICDFYEREVVNLSRLKPSNVVDFEETITMWINRAKRMRLYEAVDRLKKILKK